MPKSIILQFLWHYGYIVLFAGLFLELIALPIPGEFLMTYSGFLVFQGQLHWGLSILIAGLGSVCGITVTYWIGSKLGRPFFEKYGAYIHLGPENLERVAGWFAKYGNWVLVFAYFIPGLRHITGYFAGVSRIRLRQFMGHAYLGAFLWSITFISLGKVFGPRWAKFHGPIRRYLFIGCLILIVASIIVYFYKNYRTTIYESFFNFLAKTVRALHSLKRAKVMLSVTLALFSGLAYLMVRFIKAFLANEFNQFNEVSLSLLKLIFTEHWVAFIRLCGGLASVAALFIVVGLTLLWIFIKREDRWLEAGFLLSVAGGGLILREVLHLIFDHLSLNEDPILSIIHQFPCQRTLLVLAVYGFSAFLLARHAGNFWLRALVSPAVIGIVILTGLNQVLFKIQYPSDVLAGLIFGAVWLSFNILLCEVFRVLGRDNFENRQWLE